MGDLAGSSAPTPSLRWHRPSSPVAASGGEPTFRRVTPAAVSAFFTVLALQPSSMAISITDEPWSRYRWRSQAWLASLGNRLRPPGRPLPQPFSLEGP